MVSRKVALVDRLQWVIEALSDHPAFFMKRMFGARAVYWGERLVICTVCRGHDPWDGLLVPTEREFHAELRGLYPSLMPHQVLGKWLYLSQSSEDFESCTLKILERIRGSDRRFGVIPVGRRKQGRQGRKI